MRNKDIGWRLMMENLRTISRGGTQGRKEGIEMGDGGLNWLRLLTVVVLTLLWSRAFFLQVVLGRRNSLLAEGNRVEIRRIVSERGVIKDRLGEVLARNSLDSEGRTRREYPLGETAAHLLGYIGEISREELESCGGSCSKRPGDMVGKAGVERLKEMELTGKQTRELVEVNAQGEILRTLKKEEGQTGQTVELTVDGELQKTIVRVLADYEVEKGRSVRGAVVVSKTNGEILALNSWPSFDNNIFSAGRKDKLEMVLGDVENKPMLNRAVGGGFAPGSVYKLVTAVVGLEEGKIDESTLIEDVGELKVGQYRYGSWYFDQYGGVEGAINVVKALARSNDVFFYKVGELVGVNKLVEWSRKLGLGQKTGLNWPGEVAGLVSDPLEKERRIGEQWFLGNTYHMAIGQGDLLVNPLQVARMTAAVVSGKLCQPRLVKGEEVTCQELGIKQETREIILRGMQGACSQGGTAFPFFEFPIRVACKTGTAQHGGEKTEPHAWIAVIVPSSKFEVDSLEGYEKGVVITVLLEEAGEGSYEAGPVAEKIARFVVDRGY